LAQVNDQLDYVSKPNANPTYSHKDSDLVAGNFVSNAYQGQTPLLDFLYVFLTF
jgi:hypothetical protein